MKKTVSLIAVAMFAALCAPAYAASHATSQAFKKADQQDQVAKKGHKAGKAKKSKA